MIELGFTNFFIQTFGPVVNFNPQVGFFELGFNCLGMGYQIIVDRQNDGLNRCQPQRELAGEMLDQNAQKALNGAENGAVNHDRPVPFIVLADKGQVEALRQGHIQLDGAALPGPAQGVFDMQIDFRAVKSAVAFIERILLTVSLEPCF